MAWAEAQPAFGCTDFRTILAKARTSKPDTYVLVGFGRPLGLLVRQLREGGFTGPFVASLGFVVTPEALDSAGEAMRGGYFLTYASLSDPAVRKLHKRYLDRFGEEPSPSIVLDYAILFVLIQSRIKDGEDPATMATFIRKQRVFETPIGELTAANAGSIIAPVRIRTVPKSGPIDLWEEP